MTPDQDDSDPTATPDDATDPPDEAADGTGPTEGPSGREVVVPMRLYKTVTVMATLLAMVSVVAGFVFLDVATNRAQAELSEIDPLLALVGLGLILAGAGTYAYSTRFRAEGMGRSKSDETDNSNDG